MISRERSGGQSSRVRAGRSRRGASASWRRVALVVCTALLVMPVWTSGRAAGFAEVTPACRPQDSRSCSLRELATPMRFRIGATAEPGEIGPGPYATTLAREFNAVTPENALKWYTVQPSPGDWQFGSADAVVTFAEDHGLEVRGHTLVWAQDAHTPAWVRSISDPAVLRAKVDEEIRTVVGRYAGRIHRWDVVNEPLATLGTGPSNSVFWRVLGPAWVADAFRSAHAADPAAELWLNEYGTEWAPLKHQALVALVKGLLDDGVPVHGVGLQTHRFGVGGPDPAAFAAQMRDFTDLGVKVAITELDVLTDPSDAQGPTKQAAAYGRIVGTRLAVKGCEEVTTWGLTDAATWLDHLGFFTTPTRPLLFDEQFQPKPAYATVHALLAQAAAPPTTTTSTSTSTASPTTSTTSSTTTTTTPVASVPRAQPAGAVRASARFAG